MMLNRVIGRCIIRGFSTQTPTVIKSPQVNFEKVSQQSDVTKWNVQSSDLLEIKEEIRNEKAHLVNYVNEIKSQINEGTTLNYEVEENNRTLILQTNYSSGSNYYKLGELLTVGSTAGLLYQLTGFPSYAALGGTLGLAAVGAVLSYSNYLKRTSPQITQIYLGKNGKLQVLFRKSGLGGAVDSVETDKNNFRHVSFGCSLLNWLRKSNETSWVKINGQYFWYNSCSGQLRVNSHHINTIM